MKKVSLIIFILICTTLKIYAGGERPLVPMINPSIIQAIQIASHQSAHIERTLNALRHAPDEPTRQRISDLLPRIIEVQRRFIFTLLLKLLFPTP